MNEYTRSQKNELRNLLLSRRRALPKSASAKLSTLIIKRVLAVKKFKEASCFLVYLPIGNEADTKFLIKYLVQNRKKIFIIAYSENKWIVSTFKSLSDLEKNHFQTLQPKKIERADSFEIDVAIIPGVAFSKEGVRLGFGKGIYDKILRGSRALKIGLGYDFQILDYVPFEEHDLKMDLLVSEKRIIDLRTI